MMPSGKFVPVALLVFAVRLSVPSQTQSSQGSSALYPTKSLPADTSDNPFNTKPVPALANIPPSSVKALSSSSSSPLEYRPRDLMTDRDRELATSTEPSIREAGALAGFEFKDGTWTYKQLVCQALPEHLFLLFERDNGAGDVSSFSVAIPRDGRRLRIVPVQRRGFSLFSPAPVNQHTISTFNRIRAEEPAAKSADWLSTALCYAALAGAHPSISTPSNLPAAGDLSLTFPPTIEIRGHGESTVRFVDAAANRPMEWALTFDSKGDLLKVVRFPAQAYSAKQLYPISARQAPAQRH